MHSPSHLRLLPPAPRPSREAPRPNLLTAAGRCDAGAVMRLAHELARDDVADAARRGRVRRYKVALRDALEDEAARRAEGAKPGAVLFDEAEMAALLDLLRRAVHANGGG